MTLLNLDNEPAKPQPAWAVVCTKSGGILAHSENLAEEIYSTGPQSEDLGIDNYKPNTGLVMWEGTMGYAPCGTYDGPEGGAEWDLDMRGTFRPLTDAEAIKVARGEL